MDIGIDFETTKDIVLPKDPFDLVIGQTRAVKIARIAAKQRRHLLLVGPPGIGKSMIARAMAYYIPKPKEEIVVFHNPRNPERPFIAVRTMEDIERERKARHMAKGRILDYRKLPPVIAERMGFKCKKCGNLSPNDESICPNCNEFKFDENAEQSEFAEIISRVFNVGIEACPEEEVHVSRIDDSGNEEIIVYQNIGGGRVRVVDKEAFENLSLLEKQKQSKVIVPLKRNPFVQATGVSETELLGDVRHDPWGGLPEAGGVPPYQRVIPGAIHEAHEGILFIDEISQLDYLQRYILTAMQDKYFPISGMNATSSGAAVKVTKVPCDFILVGACNTTNIEDILPPLRSRILGSGYEVLLETTMPYNTENVKKLVQFFAQEVLLDRKIRHGTKNAVVALIKEAKRRAKEIDDVNGLTLRLRDLGGIIRLAGDIAVDSNSEYIERKHILDAIKSAKSVEHQLVERYGSLWKGKAKDVIAEKLLSAEQQAQGYV
jgi:ATP-dependent Lon protease